MCEWRRGRGAGKGMEGRDSLDASFLSEEVRDVNATAKSFDLPRKSQSQVTLLGRVH